ncbi:hypothetical protein, partial [Halalkalibaculum sp. DA384]|uniref:hypothetical protein n=1 Tax=Halalkalibaculum sp. DA384 TaxID=3373606 RepID=UPI003755002E
SGVLMAFFCFFSAHNEGIKRNGKEQKGTAISSAFPQFGYNFGYNLGTILRTHNHGITQKKRKVLLH